MWLAKLSDQKVREVLGECAPEILACLLAVDRETGFKTPSRGQEDYQAAKERFGRNGPAIELFLESWKAVSWRGHEGEPVDQRAIQVVDYNQALDPTSSKHWQHAMLEAGYGSSDRFLSVVWQAGKAVGEMVGGHHAAFLAAASCGELAQMPEKDAHFFLEMMPWIRAGHWPCGWDDVSNRLKVL